MKLVIIDGQSGRMGALLAERIKAAKLPCEVLAVGTNAIATAAMMKAGADQGATGENPVLVACRTADVIAGPIGILSADALLGEITPRHGGRRGAKPRKKAAAAGKPQLRPHRGRRPGSDPFPTGGRAGRAAPSPVPRSTRNPVIHRPSRYL